MAFSKGDKVQWNTPQGPTQGTVRSEHTDEFEFKGQTFKATGKQRYGTITATRQGVSTQIRVYVE